MSKQEGGSAEEPEYPRWNRVYITVIIYAICLIVGLWLFSKMFQ